MPKVALLCLVSKASIFFSFSAWGGGIAYLGDGSNSSVSAVFSCIGTILCLPVVSRLSALQCSGHVKEPDHEKTSVSECLPAHFSPSSFHSAIQFALTTGNTRPDFEKFLFTNMQMGLSEYAWAQTPMEAWSGISFWLWLIKNSFKIRHQVREWSYIMGQKNIYINRFFIVQCWEPSHLWHSYSLHPSPAIMVTVHLFNIYFFLFSLIISFLLPSFHHERISVSENLLNTSHPDSFEIFHFRSLWAFTYIF